MCSSLLQCNQQEGGGGGSHEASHESQGSKFTMHGSKSRHERRSQSARSRSGEKHSESMSEKPCEFSDIG